MPEVPPAAADPEPRRSRAASWSIASPAVAVLERDLRADTVGAARYSPAVTASDPQRDVRTLAAAPGAPAATMQTALIALHSDSAVRMSRLALATVVLCLWGLLMDVAFYRSGSPWLQWTARAALLVTSVSSLVAWRVALATWRHRLLVLVSWGVLVAVTALIVHVYFGVFSPYAAAIALGIAVLGAVDRTGVVVPICVVMVAVHLTLATLITLGVVADPGVFATVNQSIPERLVMAMFPPAIYGAALWQGRVSRRSMLEAIERSNRAVLEARQREVLLAEANRNLDDMLRAGAGLEGRYTGRTVGDFEMGALVGRGAMGEVYAARRVGDGRSAAVKLLNATALQDAELVERFLREADIAGRLKVPHVVEVLEAGRGPDGAPYLAMELLAGHDLAWHLRQQPRLPLDEVTALVDQVSLGLEAAHAAGIVHRDLKPQNLLLHEPSAPASPQWKILDFGVSKLRGSGGTLTGGAILGTPGYMPPEQTQGGAVDARADVFSLGAVVYRALTGQPAFSSVDIQALFEVVYKQPLAPSDVVRGLPADVDRVIAIALSKSADRRFAGAREFALAFAAAARGALSTSLRARADALLGEQPWGSVRPAS